MRLIRIAATAMAICTLGGAANAAETSYLGKHTFNWLKSPGKQRCIKVDAKLQKRFASKEFKCEANHGRTEAGQSVPACEKVSGGIGYLIFDTRAACEAERKAQASNAED